MARYEIQSFSVPGAGAGPTSVPNYSDEIARAGRAAGAGIGDALETFLRIDNAEKGTAALEGLREGVRAYELRAAEMDPNTILTGAPAEFERLEAAFEEQMTSGAIERDFGPRGREFLAASQQSLLETAIKEKNRRAGNNVRVLIEGYREGGVFMSAAEDRLATEQIAQSLKALEESGHPDYDALRTSALDAGRFVERGRRTDYIDGLLADWGNAKSQATLARWVNDGDAFKAETGGSNTEHLRLRGAVRRLMKQDQADARQAQILANQERQMAQAQAYLAVSAAEQGLDSVTARIAADPTLPTEIDKTLADVKAARAALPADMDTAGTVKALRLDDTIRQIEGLQAGQARLREVGPEQFAIETAERQTAGQWDSSYARGWETVAGSAAAAHARDPLAFKVKLGQEARVWPITDPRGLEQRRANGKPTPGGGTSLLIQDTDLEPLVAALAAGQSEPFQAITNAGLTSDELKQVGLALRGAPGVDEKKSNLGWALLTGGFDSVTADTLTKQAQLFERWFPDQTPAQIVAEMSDGTYEKLTQAFTDPGSGVPDVYAAPATLTAAVLLAQSRLTQSGEKPSELTGKDIIKAAETLQGAKLEQHNGRWTWVAEGQDLGRIGNNLYRASPEDVTRALGGATVRVGPPDPAQMKLSAEDGEAARDIATAEGYGGNRHQINSVAATVPKARWRTEFKRLAAGGKLGDAAEHLMRTRRAASGPHLSDTEFVWQGGTLYQLMRDGGIVRDDDGNPVVLDAALLPEAPAGPGREFTDPQWSGIYVRPSR